MRIEGSSSRLVVSLAAAALIGTHAQGFTPLRPGDHTIQVEHAGLPRRYLVQTVTRLVYEGCRPGGQVEHLRLTGAGHGWPGADVPRSRGRLIGPGTTLVRASEEAWTFLSRFSRYVRAVQGAQPTSGPDTLPVSRGPPA